MIYWAAFKTFLAGIPRQVWIMLAAALLVAVGLRYVYNKGAASQEAETAIVQTKLDAALDANKTNLDAIAKLEAANKELAEGRAADTEKAANALASLETDRKALAKALATEKNRRSRIYARNPEAAVIGSTVLPDGLTSSLRVGADQD